MNVTCAQFDERLSEYLEGSLPGAEQAAADAHARGCARCGEWLDARQAVLLLRGFELLETPPGLETRILALTVAPPPRESFWAALAAGWQTMRQPRFALSFAAAVFSLGIALNAMGFSLRDVRPEDLTPSGVYRALDRQAHLTYARASRFVNDLRVVYEIRSRLEAMQPEPEAPLAPAPAPSRQPTPQNKKPESSLEGKPEQRILAWHAPYVLYYGEKR